MKLMHNTLRKGIEVFVAGVLTLGVAGGCRYDSKNNYNSNDYRAGGMTSGIGGTTGGGMTSGIGGTEAAGAGAVGGTEAAGAGAVGGAEAGGAGAVGGTEENKCCKK